MFEGSTKSRVLANFPGAWQARQASLPGPRHVRIQTQELSLAAREAQIFSPNESRFVSIGVRRQATLFHALFLSSSSKIGVSRCEQGQALSLDLGLGLGSRKLVLELEQASLCECKVRAAQVGRQTSSSGCGGGGAI